MKISNFNSFFNIVLFRKFSRSQRFSNHFSELNVKFHGKFYLSLKHRKTRWNSECKSVQVIHTRYEKRAFGIRPTVTQSKLQFRHTYLPVEHQPLPVFISSLDPQNYRNFCGKNIPPFAYVFPENRCRNAVFYDDNLAFLVQNKKPETLNSFSSKNTRVIFCIPKLTRSSPLHVAPPHCCL